MNTRSLLSITAVALALAVSPSAHAFTGYWSYTYTSTGSPGSIQEYQLAPGPSVCFLQRLAGSIATTANGVFLTEKNGFWFLNVDPNGGSVQVDVICLPTYPNMTTFWMDGRSEWVGGGLSNGATQLPTTNAPGTVCGLTAVGSIFGTGLSSTSDSVNVTQQNGKWFINGTGNAFGIAICAVVTDSAGGWTWINPSPGFNQLGLTSAPDNGASPLGTQCFLSGVWGNFTTPLGSANDRVSVDHSAQKGWTLNVGTGKGAQVTCVQ